MIADAKAHHARLELHGLRNMNGLVLLILGFEPHLSIALTLDGELA